jgi:ubiquinone/menaquinone biosynthesis C-methylase UbiE
MSLRVKYWMLSQLVQWMSPPGSVIRTLELGCGEGLFLEIVQDNPRFYSTGLDLCEKSVEKALTKVLDAHQSDLESKNYPDDTFDFVFAFHQLEHVQNPEGLVLEMQRILKPGGHLFVALPCISHLTARLAGRRWKHLRPPEHLWYFSPLTLSKFVTRLGFETTFSSSLYPRAHLHLFARKCGDVDRAAIPRWMGTHAADVDAADKLTKAA